MTTPGEEVRAVEPLRMDAYYYHFDATGVREIDLILSAVACAGKAAHHTESWSDNDDEDWSGYYPPHTGRKPVNWIQNAASQAAVDYESLRARAERAERERDAAKSAFEQVLERGSDDIAALRQRIEEITEAEAVERAAVQRRCDGWQERAESAERERDAYSARIEELQAALCRWLPKVPKDDHPWQDQICDDACLLIGLELDVPEWGAQVWRERDALVKDKVRLDWIESEAMRCGVIEVCYYGWSEEDGTQGGAACIQFGIEEGSSIRTEIDAELLASTVSAQDTATAST